jgi:hypothetical protein
MSAGLWEPDPVYSFQFIRIAQRNSEYAWAFEVLAMILSNNKVEVPVQLVGSQKKFVGYVNEALRINIPQIFKKILWQPIGWVMVRTQHVYGVVQKQFHLRRDENSNVRFSKQFSNPSQFEKEFRADYEIHLHSCRRLLGYGQDWRQRRPTSGRGRRAHLTSKSMLHVNCKISAQKKGLI